MKWPLFAGTFKGIRIYESSLFGTGTNSAGLALPGIGIFVGAGTFSCQLDLPIVYHEFGHFLQCRQTGWFRFYLFVGFPSLISAWTKGFGKGHQQFWTELWCNHLAKKSLNHHDWSETRFPSQDLSVRSRYWLTS